MNQYPKQLYIGLDNKSILKHLGFEYINHVYFDNE